MTTPARGPLPVGLLTEEDISSAFQETVRYLDSPESSEFDPVLFGFVCAAREALARCQEALALARIGRELAAKKAEPEPGYREWMRIGQEEVARQVARGMINALRQWVPEQRP